MISEVYKKVSERIAASEGGCEACGMPETAADKPKLLILTDAHGDICHQALECPVLGRVYQTECALLMDNHCDIADYDVVIAYTLTNESLGKIANGIFDSDYTRLFGNALLTGKKIFVPKEEIELYKYKDTAPAVYYQRMEANLKVLTDSGVTVVENSQLSSVILKDSAPSPQPAAVQETVQPAAHFDAIREFVITKKVVTERDMILAGEEKAGCVILNEKAILTDLAKDYAKKRGIALVFGRPNEAKGGAVG